mgnify:CR=1 FL=1
MELINIELSVVKHYLSAALRLQNEEIERRANKLLEEMDIDSLITPQLNVMVQNKVAEILAEKIVEIIFIKLSLQPEYVKYNVGDSI